MSDRLIQGIGIIAGICTAVSLIPQIVKILKEKKADDISIVYLIVLLLGLALWIVYGILRKDVPVIATNILSITINLITIVLRMKYRHNNKMV